MSPALLNGASWWTKFLELKPSVRLAVGRTTRETVWAWTDASGEYPCLGVVVYARGRWYYTYCKEYTSYYRKLATKTVHIQQEELHEH